MASGTVQGVERVVSGHGIRSFSQDGIVLHAGSGAIVDTHETKTFPADVISASERGDSTAVMLAAESLGDASCPQPIYQHLVEAEVMEAMPGMYMVASRRAVEATFKNTDVFSSEGFLELGNVRPLIPLSVDPPRHLKYRKILDPIFAPRQMD